MKKEVAIAAQQDRATRIRVEVAFADRAGKYGK
jgi:hypothetical protein